MSWRWFGKKAAEVEDILEVDEPVREPELGPFDHPHKIRDADLLTRQAEEPLPDEAAENALRHRMQGEQVRRDWFDDHGGAISIIDGVLDSEANDPHIQQLVAEHEDRLRIAREQAEAARRMALLKPWQVKALALLDRAHAAIEKKVFRL